MTSIAPSKQVHNTAISEAMAQYVSDKLAEQRKAFADEIRSLKTEVAQLQKQLDARQSAAENFSFVRASSSEVERRGTVRGRLLRGLNACEVR